MSQKDNTLLRQFCECGKPATIKRNNSKICQRCADLDSQIAPTTAGIPDRDPGFVRWLDVRAACVNFFGRYAQETIRY